MLSPGLSKKQTGFQHKNYPAKLVAYENNLLIVGINYDKTRKSIRVR